MARIYGLPTVRHSAARALPQPLDPFERWARDQAHGDHENAPGPGQLIALGVCVALAVLGIVTWVVMAQ